MRFQIVRQRHGIVGVRAKPGLPPIKPSAYLPSVIIEHNFYAIDAAAQAGRRDLDLGRFVARHSRVRDRDAPEKD